MTAVATHLFRGRAGDGALRRSSAQGHAHAAPVHHYAWHALEEAYRIGQKPVDVETVQEVLAPDLDGYGLRGSRARMAGYRLLPAVVPIQEGERHTNLSGHRARRADPHPPNRLPATIDQPARLVQGGVEELVLDRV